MIVFEAKEVVDFITERLSEIMIRISFVNCNRRVLYIKTKEQKSCNHKNQILQKNTKVQF